MFISHLNNDMTTEMRSTEKIASPERYEKMKLKNRFTLSEIIQEFIHYVFAECDIRKINKVLGIYEPFIKFIKKYNP